MTEWPEEESEEETQIIAQTQSSDVFITLDVLSQQDTHPSPQSQGQADQAQVTEEQAESSIPSPTLTDLCKAIDEEVTNERNALPQRTRVHTHRDGSGMHCSEDDELVSELVFDELAPSGGQEKSTQEREVQRWLRRDSDPEREESPHPIERPATPVATLFQVIDHGLTTQKTKDWSLSVTEKTIIMGDSNLRRIGNHAVPGMQIDSFPGAGFQHAESILSKVKKDPEVREVIMSFTINHRGLPWKDSFTTQILGALEKAGQKFPRAQIYIPLLNFSPKLNPSEIGVLKKLNAFIRENSKFIPPLPDRDFQTGADNIHWTYETARNMLHYWVEFLNAQSP